MVGENPTSWHRLEPNGFCTLDERITNRLRYGLSPMAELLALRALVIAIRNEGIVPLNALDEIGRGFPRLNHYIRELVAKGIWSETEWGWRMDTGRSRHRITSDDRWMLTAALRAQVLDHYGAFCQACGSVESIAIDHIVPVAKGGRTVFDNLQPLCGSCNGAKGTMSWADFLTMRRG